MAVAYKLYDTHVPTPVEITVQTLLQTGNVYKL